MGQIYSNVFDHGTTAPARGVKRPLDQLPHNLPRVARDNFETSLAVVGVDQASPGALPRPVPMPAHCLDEIAR